MLGLAPIAAAPLSDDGDRLSRIQSSAVGEVALSGNAGGGAKAAGVVPVAVLPVPVAARCIGNIEAQGSGGLNVTANAQNVGPVEVVAAEDFSIVTDAMAGLATHVASDGSIAFTVQGDARTGGYGVVLSELDFDRVAEARCATLASGLGRPEASGVAKASATLRSDGSGSITLACQLAADTIVEGAAARKMGIGGTTEGVAQTRGVGTASVILAGRAAAGAAQRAAANGAMALGGSSRAATASTSRTIAAGPALSGFALGSTLEARFADIAGRLSLGVSASAAVEAHAIADALFAGSMEALGNVSTCSAITGGLSLARELDAGVMASGEANREIGLAGAAHAVTVAAAEAAAVGLEVTVASEARGASVGTVSDTVTVYGQTEMVSAVAGGATTTLASASVFGATTGSNAVVEAEASLQGENCSASSIYAVASPPLGIFVHCAGDVSPVAKTTSQLDMSGGTVGYSASGGQGRGTLDVARDFTGDLDVLGDSIRQISLRGAASARTTSTGKTSNSVVEVAGWGVTRATTAAEAAASITLRGHAQSRVTGVATVETTLAWRIRSAVTAPRSVQIRGTLSLAGAGQAEAVARGAARAAGLPLNAVSEGKTALAADLATDLGLGGEARVRLVTRAQGTGRFKVGRASDADAQVTGDAARVLSFMGVAEGAIAAQGTSAEGMASLPGGATAKNQLHVRLPFSASIALPGLAQSNTGTQGRGAGEFGVARMGLGEVLLIGTALRGMPLLGASAARITTLAAAKKTLVPSLAGSAANVIQLALAAEAITPHGCTAGSNLAEAPEVSALWDLGTTSIAYRAPPALRRAEPPKYGLSGRLSPSNSGRILRG